MLLSLQLLLLVVACLTTTVMLTNIRKSSITIDDSLFWFFFSAILLFFSLFPNAIIVFSSLLGFESPANFVFLVIVFLLIVNQYRMTTKVARLEMRLKQLIQHVAIKESHHDD